MYLPTFERNDYDLFVLKMAFTIYEETNKSRFYVFLGFPQIVNIKHLNGDFFSTH